MSCDSKEILSDLRVSGTILSYTELWLAGTKKEEFEGNTNSLLLIFNFEYKATLYFNIFTSDSNEDLVSAEIHTGTYSVDGQMVDDTTLIERILY